MNNPSFFRGAFRAVFCLIITGLLAACAPIMEPPDAEGNLSIFLSGGSMSRAISAETEAALSYTLGFTGPGGETLSRTTEPGTPSLTLSLGLGAWTIKAQAFLSGELYGTGETAVTVEAGKTNEVTIIMRKVDSDDDSGDWHMTVYVAAGGSGDGSEASPFGTVAQALSVIEDAYGEGDWPEDDDSIPVPARILISGSITEAGSANGMVDITDTALYTKYPPIILAGKGTDAEAGILNANNTKRVLYINKANVTLGENLSLTRGNTSNNGGGVYVDGGIFTMNGGTIGGENADKNIADAGSGCGGGVYINNGTFSMSMGTISGNTAHTGGGVYLSGSSSNFTMSGNAKISGNEVGNDGGGVYILGGNFTMDGEDAAISENRAGDAGGGVVFANGTFSMSKGTINDNIATSRDGGGVQVYGGTFAMSGTATISGNKALSGNGGGVYVDDSGTFTKTGGTIYGLNESTTLKNTVGTGKYGPAVYVYHTPTPKKRDWTANTEDDLAYTPPSTFTGGWDP